MKYLINLAYLIISLLVLFISAFEIRNSDADPYIIFFLTVFVWPIIYFYLITFKNQYLQNIKRKFKLFPFVGVISISILLTALIFKLNYYIPLKTEYNARQLFHARVMEEKDKRYFKVIYKSITGLSDECLADSVVCWKNDSIMVKETVGLFGMRTNQRDFKLWREPHERVRENWRRLN